jgi:hypothetical protein
MDDIQGVIEDNSVLVTETRDFGGSRILGRLRPGSVVSFSNLLGSRAQISYIFDKNIDEERDIDDRLRSDKENAVIAIQKGKDGKDMDNDNNNTGAFQDLNSLCVGGWVSLVVLETGEPLFEKVLPVSPQEYARREQQQQVAEAKAKQDEEERIREEKKIAEAQGIKILTKKYRRVLHSIY